MSFFSRIVQAFRSTKRLVGRDLEESHGLEGNKFYENRVSAYERPKRTVEYRREEDMWDYIGGQRRLPIQWSAWMSHTRANPPTIEELEADLRRQMQVKHNASLIEAKDREEAEQLRQLQAANHADLVRLSASKEGEPPVVHGASDAGAPLSGQDHDRQTEAKQPTTSKENPWAAADAPLETQSWSPTAARRRG